MTPNLKIIRFTIQISQNISLGFYVPYGSPYRKEHKNPAIYFGKMEW